VKDNSAEKIKLIYEFNRESPLFARVAASELEKGNYLEAVKMLDDGIHRHANYPSAFLVLSLAKAYEGKEEEARIIAKIGADLIGSNITYETYLQRIAEIISERESVNETLRPTFHQVANEDSITSENSEILEDNLDILARQLSKAKIIPREDIEVNPETVPQFQGKKIVSETLADIHLSQRNYEAAIEMYEELINQKPEKAAVYLQKISEIKSAM
jgi:tetratricopeptide (TPR) repeat protein